MNIENHFKNFSDFENKIQNLKILEFVEHFEIKNLKNLRNLNSWSEMENSVLKKKIYNKVYYQSGTLFFTEGRTIRLFSKINLTFPLWEGVCFSYRKTYYE